MWREQYHSAFSSFASIGFAASAGVALKNRLEQ